jgi:hypothetical protein
MKKTVSNFYKKPPSPLLLATCFRLYGTAFIELILTGLLAMFVLPFQMAFLLILFISKSTSDGEND